MALNSGSMVESKPATIRESVNETEKLLLEAHNVLDSLIGTIPTASKESEKQLEGSATQAVWTIQHNNSLAAYLLSRLVELRDKI